MKFFGAFFLLMTAVAGHAVELQQKSVSLSRQFVVYCADSLLRLKTTSFAEETKASMLSLLGLSDDWKLPIVIAIDAASAASPDQPSSQLGIFETESGAKIELRVRLKAENPFLQHQIVRALLLEQAYRKAAIKGGSEYRNPPPWLVEAIVLHQMTRGTDMRPAIYKTMVARNQFPSLSAFLKSDPAKLDSTSLNYYRAFAFALLELLIDLPAGKQSLSSYVRALSSGATDPLEEIRSKFSALGESDQTFEKWWSLSIAKLSASSRHEGLSLNDTEQRLNALLVLPVSLKGETQQFSFGDYRKFIKLAEARKLLRQRQNELLWLSVDANALFRPVVLEYQKIAALLARGKTGRITKKLKHLAEYRQAVLQRLDEVADYLNWIEATQLGARSDSFDGYIRAANDLAIAPPKLRGPISRYLDSVELEFQ